jgi:hypothetical protein
MRSHLAIEHKREIAELAKQSRSVVGRYCVIDAEAEVFNVQ